ncbi:hypothetical protein AABB24_016244, partial [Solanum stoloniferum]
KHKSVQNSLRPHQLSIISTPLKPNFFSTPPRETRKPLCISLMATMASLFLKTPGPSQSLPKTHKTHFVLPQNLPLSWRSKYRAEPPAVAAAVRIRCGLIDPDGGKLVELIVEEPQRDLKRRQALSLPQIKLSKIDIQWVHVLSEGWASPLKGFMRESEFLQTLHFNSLRL